VTGRLHQVARSCRAAAPGDFDDAWRARAGEVPSWLALDSAVIDIAIEWVQTRTYVAAFPVATAQRQVLVSDATDLALTEVDLLLGREDATREERSILGVARERSFEEAYAPYLRREAMVAFLDADLTMQAELLQSQRHSLLEVGPQEVAGVLATDRASHHAGAALLTLARQDLDEEALSALGSAGLLAELAGQLVSGGDGESLLALRQLLGAVTVEPAHVAVALFHAAVAKVLASETQPGIELLREARRADDQAVSGLVPTLLTWTGQRPELAVLAPVLAEHLPDEGDEEV